MRGLILLLMIVYVISPVDAYPGPIDDFIVIALGLAAKKGMLTKRGY